MKYKLVNDYNLNKNSPKEIILNNRGIDAKKYLTLDDSCLHSFSSLANIQEAVSLLLKHIELLSDIGIVVDSDADGQCSASILYQYLKEIYPEGHIEYYIHTKKQHGLSSEIKIPNNIKLLFVPDAGTNDVNQCKALRERGIDVIILDHHQREIDNPYAVIVNPQLDNYPNNELSGGAVVYKYLQALDDELWENRADKYLDLVALSIIADSMDLRPYENKRLVDKGLSNIQNPLFQALIQKQDYSIGGVVNIINVMFYIIPLINGLIRSSTQEEKEMMFKAFSQMYEEFDYKKRGETELVKEDIYTRVARLCVNCKAKQNREVDKVLESINQNIEKYKWNENKILFANADNLDGSYIGLVAMKLASQYSKPCILVRELDWKKGFLNGSGRNYDNSAIDNLKDFMLSTGLVSFAAGHNSAFGCEIKKENIKDVIAKTNEMLIDVDFDKVYHVDFILSPEELTYDFVLQVNELKDYYGQNIGECLVAVENIKMNTKDIEIMGANKDTWKFMLNDDVSIIRFKCKEDDEILRLINEDWGGTEICVTIVGRCGINNFNQISSPQLVVSDYIINK